MRKITTKQQDILNMYNSGMSQKAITDNLGVTAGYISRTMHILRSKIPSFVIRQRQPGPITQEDIDICEAVDPDFLGLSYPKAAVYLGIRECTVRTRIRRLRKMGYRPRHREHTKVGDRYSVWMDFEVTKKF